MSLRQLTFWGCAAGALALAAFVVFQAAEEPSRPKVAGVELPVPAANNANGPGDVESKTPASALVDDKPPLIDLKGDFTTAADLWVFAEVLLQDARAGDLDYQYYLAHTLRYCESLYRFYFIRGEKRRTLDEGMQWASTRVGVSADEARTVHERCHRVQTADGHPFGTAEQWLTSAANAGQPFAQIDLANRLALKAGVAGELENVEMRDDAKRLALEALRSKNPQVVFQFADLSRLFLSDPSKASEVEWTWRLAACQRGYDCGKHADWLSVMCRFDYNCQPQDDGVEFIRRNNSQNFDTIERKATVTCRPSSDHGSLENGAARAVS